jgi:hypothetical protein
MQCNIVWNIEFLTKNLKKVFLQKKYKIHRENILFERERSMFAETMPYTENRIRIRELEREIKQLYSNVNETVAKRNDLISYTENTPFEDKLKFLLNCKEYNIEISRLHVEISFRTSCITLLYGRPHSEATRKFIRCCPVADCRGFLSTQWKCGLCNTWTCPECNEVIGLDKTESNHVCLESNLKTAELLKKDSRACPKCAAMIFRISGCPVMFCTNCHTGFNWNTGLEHKGQIHNPHYFEYMRSRQQDPQEEEVLTNEIMNEHTCNGQDVPRVKLLMDLERKLFAGYNNPKSNSISRIIEYRAHVMDMVIPNLLPGINIADLNRDLRISYLLNDITEKNFKMALQQREKMENKKNDNLMVYQMFVDVCLDLLRRYAKDVNTEEKHAVIMHEFTKLMEYTKDCLVTTGKNYNCVPLLLLGRYRLD